MADETPDPIASTAAFRAFSSDGDRAGDQPGYRKPTFVVFVTAIVLLFALLLGVLAFAL